MHRAGSTWSASRSAAAWAVNKCTGWMWPTDVRSVLPAAVLCMVLGILMHNASMHVSYEQDACLSFIIACWCIAHAQGQSSLQQHGLICPNGLQSTSGMSPPNAK
jgi:hypothetical protein